jgi:DNA-binding CsgD family transcriptional regulator
MQKDLKKSKEELAAQKNTLEEKNVALKELIAHIELDKKELKDRIKANVEQVVMPSLEKIRLSSREDGYIEQLRRALEDLTSSFGLKVVDSRIKLTPRETEVCNMVKNGLTSKEIARMLNIALHTVEKHRRNARSKLALGNKGINLRTYLSSP